MKGFGRFIISGPLPAFTAVFGFSLLAFFILPLSILVSSAAIVLITLYAGVRQGLVITAACVIALSICSYALLAPSRVLPDVLMIVAQLLPAVILATIFHTTRSLSFTLQVAALLGVLAFLGVVVLFPDVERAWEGLLHQILSSVPLGNDYLMQQPQLVQQSAQLMSGMLVASAVLTNSGVMLLGYWWHCLTTDSGDFRSDFCGLQLGKVLAIIVVLSSVWATVLKSAFATQLCIIVGVLFLLQGMAIIHAVMTAVSKGKIWLIAVYVLIVFVPQLVLVVVLAGLIDTFIDIRKRVSPVI